MLGTPSSSSRSLDELGLGLVAGAGDAHELALGELRLDLARPLVRSRDGASTRLRRPSVDQRHAAVAGRSARRAGMRGAAARADERPVGAHRLDDLEVALLGHAAVGDLAGAHVVGSSPA